MPETMKPIKCMLAVRMMMTQLRIILKFINKRERKNLNRKNEITLRKTDILKRSCERKKKRPRNKFF